MVSRYRVQLSSIVLSAVVMAVSPSLLSEFSELIWYKEVEYWEGTQNNFALVGNIIKKI